MPNTKYALIRQKVLDRCLSDKTRKYTMKMLMDECNKHMGEGFEITALNTIRADIREIDAEFGRVEIYRGSDGRNKYYRYENPNFSIYHTPLTDSQTAGLLQAVTMLRGFEGMPQYKWLEELMEKFNITLSIDDESEMAVGFDQNPDLEGRHFFTQIYDYIIKKAPIHLTYKSFRSTEPISCIVHPYYLKEYNNRWFFLAWNQDVGFLSNFALDRVISIEPTDTEFVPMKDFSISDYYEEMIGVTRNMQDESQKVRLWVSASSLPYIKTKPLHGTQKVLNITPSGAEIEIDVILNYELEQTILSYGENMKVLSPQSLVDKIKERTLKLAELYKQ